MNRITITTNGHPLGPNAVLVECETLEADIDWWEFAAKSAAWTVDHFNQPGSPNMVRAHRKCRGGTQARQLSERTRRQIERSIRRLSTQQLRNHQSQREGTPHE